MITTDGLDDLRDAIIIRAVQDYENALISCRTSRRMHLAESQTDKTMISDCEKFFRGSWMMELSNVNGEFLIEKVRKKVGVW